METANFLSFCCSLSAIPHSLSILSSSRHPLLSSYLELVQVLPTSGAVHWWHRSSLVTAGEASNSEVLAEESFGCLQALLSFKTSVLVLKPVYPRITGLWLVASAGSSFPLLIKVLHLLFVFSWLAHDFCPIVSSYERPAGWEHFFAWD